MSITSTSASLSIHASFVALLILLSSVRIPTKNFSPDDSPLFVPLDLLRRPPLPDSSSGGGSGANMPLPAAKGMLPRAATRVFVAPLQVRNNEQPLLELPPALDISADVPNVKMTNWGDPFASAGPLSNGPGKNGGIGNGPDRGLGPGRGNHYGPGFDGVRTIGGGVTAPRLLSKIEPEYSEEARKAKYQGSVMLRVIVDEQGVVRHVEVSRPLGLGLDEKAVEAVRKWRFQAGRQDGKPVAVWAVVEVNFRLL